MIWGAPKRGSKTLIAIPTIGECQVKQIRRPSHHLTTLGSTHSRTRSLSSSCKLMAITWLHSSVSHLGVQPSAAARKNKQMDKKQIKAEAKRCRDPTIDAAHCLLWVFDYNDAMMQHCPPPIDAPPFPEPRNHYPRQGRVTLCLICPTIRLARIASFWFLAGFTAVKQNTSD